MSYYNSMKDLIGNTPMVKLGAASKTMGISPNIQVFAKLEFYNPSGNVKDRIGKYMVEAAEREGVLKPGGTIVVATAGNTGLGIGFAALGRGYRIIFVVPTKFSQEKQTLLRALGAEVVNTPKEEGMLGAARKAEEIKAEIPGAITFNQFQNPQNPLAHYEHTGPEIYQDMDGKIDYVVAGAGSGGTFSGVMKYLKEQNPRIQGVLADPVGSTMGGGDCGGYEIEGIGNDFIPGTMDMSLVDQVFKVSDQEALEMTRLLARTEGIFAGTSSGAALAGVGKLAKTIGSGNMVTIFPDRGERYFSKGIYL